MFRRVTPKQWNAAALVSAAVLVIVGLLLLSVYLTATAPTPPYGADLSRVALEAATLGTCLMAIGLVLGGLSVYNRIQLVKADS